MYAKKPENMVNEECGVLSLPKKGHYANKCLEAKPRTVKGRGPW